MKPANQTPGEAAIMTCMTQNRSLSVSYQDGCDPLLWRLIERAREGDAAAFEDIMIRCQRRVLSTAWRMLGNEEDARDAAQDTFFRLYKYLKSYRATEDFDGWLYKIVINACRDMMRKRARSATSQVPERDLASLETIASADDVEAIAIESQQRRIITQALDSLSKKEREALVLRDLEGLSTEEVARILGSSESTVRSQISSARSKIKAFKDRLLKQRRP